MHVCTLMLLGRSKADTREQQVQDAVSKLVVQLAQQHGNFARLQLGVESSRIGTLGVARTGALGFTEVRCRNVGVVGCVCLGWRVANHCDATSSFVSGTMSRHPPSVMARLPTVCDDQKRR